MEYNKHPMLGENLRTIRKSKKLTQQQLSDAIGIKRSAYAYYEIGKSEPSINTLIKLSEVLDVSLDNLLNNESFVSSNEPEYNVDTSNFELITLINKLDTSQKREVENYIKFITKQDE